MREEPPPFARTAELAATLRQRIRGEVRFEEGDRALYATDGSNYRQVPIGVVMPRDTDDLIEAIAVVREFDAPLLMRGGGTSLAGQCCNAAVVLDASKYLDRIVAIDPDAKKARVQPGVVLDHLRGAAERYNLTFGPDPATHNHCTLGGMIGNNSCGVHSVMAGRTSENVEELEVLTYDGVRMTVGPTSAEERAAIIREGGRRGEIYGGLERLVERYAPLIRERFPNIPRRVSGYNFPDLLPENGFHVARALVGSECTCVTILEATVRLVYSPPIRMLVVLGYPTIYDAAADILRILSFGPVGLEGIDDFLVDDMVRKGLHPQNLKLLPSGRGWLMVEFGGDTREEAEEKLQDLIATLQSEPNTPSIRRFENAAQEALVWQIRESGLGATARVPGQQDTWEGWEDSAVAPVRLEHYLRGLHALYEKFGYRGSLYGHFGQGCVHTRINFDLLTASGIAKFRNFLGEASDLVLSLGGSLSGEHGDGQSRAELLPKMFGPELVQAFREFKQLWDPGWKMNPGKVVDPFDITQNLRLGTSYRPPVLQTHFAFPADDGSFARAALRCVGVGECRRMAGGTMCPSYRATHEEKHSTRGRAHLLWEMARGDSIREGWKSDYIREALDLCLACKGCKGECPVNVDVASYKAEFLSHYYAGRLRPRAAYTMGLIHRWAPLGALMPSLVNWATHTPGLEQAVKWLGGFSPQRTIPRFATRTFRSTFKAQPQGSGQQSVLLWADTFNDFFHPDTAHAAVDVLRAAGFHVVVRNRGSRLCCGRPLYDFGMLTTAKRLLQRILRNLRAEIESGMPIVVLEPSCAAVFRDELVDLFPNDEDARRLSRQVYLLGDFLDAYASDFAPKVDGTVVAHAHCHHKAVFGTFGYSAMLSKSGADYTLLDSGCCGMAGSFGFEADKYQVSMDVGELVLLPAVRSAHQDSLIVADGFSCREQIQQVTGRRTLHLSQLLQIGVQANTPPK